MSKLQRVYKNAVLQFFHSNSIPLYDSVQSSLFKETLEHFCPEYFSPFVLGFFYSNMYGFDGLFFVLGPQFDEDYSFLKGRLENDCVFGYVYNFDCPESSECGTFHF